MKKLFLLLALALVSMSSFAQRETFELGAKFNYSSEDPSLGFGVLGRYNINKHFRPELSLNFYPESHDHTVPYYRSIQALSAGRSVISES